MYLILGGKAETVEDMVLRPGDRSGGATADCPAVDWTKTVVAVNFDRGMGAGPARFAGMTG